MEVISWIASSLKYPTFCKWDVIKYVSRILLFQEKNGSFKSRKELLHRNNFEAKIPKFVPSRQRSEALIMGIMWRRCPIKLCPQNVHISYGRSWNVITLYQIGSFYLYGFKVKDLP